MLLVNCVWFGAKAVTNRMPWPFLKVRFLPAASNCGCTPLDKGGKTVLLSVNCAGFVVDWKVCELDCSVLLSD